MQTKLRRNEDDIAYMSGKINKRLAAIPRQNEEETDSKPGLLPLPIAKDLYSGFAIR
jgi:hypothetical protein